MYKLKFSEIFKNSTKFNLNVIFLIKVYIFTLKILKLNE